MQPTNQQLIKSTNIKNLFLLIQKNAGISRAALAKATHLSKATVSVLVDELIGRGYVIDCGTGTSLTTGRKPNTLTVNDAHNCLAVFQWHKSCLNVALVSLSGRMLYEMRISSDRYLDYGLITAKVFREDIEAYNPNAKILGVCLVVPAIVDKASQGILSTVLDFRVEDDVLKELRKRIPNYPIAVFNDTACYAYAEYVHSALEDSYFAFVNIGRGVGAVALDHGRFFRAANGMTTQFGHFSVDRNGPQCNCGNRGCLERMIGELYLYERSCKEGCQDLFSSKEDACFEKLGRLVAQGDKRAVKLMNALAEDTAYAISNLISLFNPKEVVIGGKGMALGKTYLDTVGDYLNRMGFPLFMKQVGLRFSDLNKSSALQGAARYFIDQYFTFDGEMQNNLFIG